jgi:hypothetical protein
MMSRGEGTTTRHRHGTARHGTAAPSLSGSKRQGDSRQTGRRRRAATRRWRRQKAAVRGGQEVPGGGENYLYDCGRRCVRQLTDASVFASTNNNEKKEEGGGGTP